MDSTTVDFYARIITSEQEKFSRDADYAAELMAVIAKNPDAASTVGDLTRLQQRVTELLRRAAKIEASREAEKIMRSETAATPRTIEK
ncbi:hypothetical protein [Streptomyces sp. NPDC007088]|uniref:hypothetical protein n=1 Tax=Streptomyces sp. NPDC007088 TaxID=3364773 RepID=UPI0036AF9E10